MSAEMARLQEHLSGEKLQATLTVEQLREPLEQATELRSQLPVSYTHLTLPTKRIV